jgi:hypothetical protein
VQAAAIAPNRLPKPALFPWTGARHVQAGRHDTGMVREAEFEFLFGKEIHLTCGGFG